ncbi:MAG: (d)CMP kinase [Elusimicrobiota bacterium]
MNNNNSNNSIITIDGPAGAGKTTIAEMVAERINYNYVDTGAMYRAMTLKVLRESVPFAETVKIEQLAQETDIGIDFIDGEMSIFLDGKDVTEKIRSEEVTDNTSLVAAIPGVRYKLAKIQRETADKFNKVIFEGRDMGSIVFPDATLKIYLDASIDERARRRWEELKDNGIDVSMEALKKKIKKRDKRDESRGLAPLRVPENAVIIDSTKMSLNEVVDKIIALLDS